MISPTIFTKSTYCLLLAMCINTLCLGVSYTKCRILTVSQKQEALSQSALARRCVRWCRRARPRPGLQNTRALHRAPLRIRARLASRARAVHDHWTRGCHALEIFCKDNVRENYAVSEVKAMSYFLDVIL